MYVQDKPPQTGKLLIQIILIIQENKWNWGVQGYKCKTEKKTSFLKNGVLVQEEKKLT